MLALLVENGLHGEGKGGGHGQQAEQLAQQAQRVQTQQQGQQSQRSQQGQQSSQSQKSLSGEVTRLGTVQVQGEEHRIVELRTQQGQTRIVDLGKTDALDIDVSKGDRLQVQGTLQSRGGQQVLLAKQVTLDGEQEQTQRRQQQAPQPSQINWESQN